MPVQENPHFRDFFALRSSVIDAISRFPIPASTSVPVRIRTMWYRKPVPV